MQILSLITEYDTTLDVLALVGSLMMILLLMWNRRKYGCMLLDKRHAKGREGFKNEVSLQMITQQSQKAYDNLQRSLTLEFESLRMLSGNDRPASVLNQTIATDKRLNHQASGMVPDSRNKRYRLAEKMMVESADAHQILERCGLAEGELELLRGLRQLEQKTRS